ncbi:tetratricopeptide repeat protein, partial [Raoultella terrigena]|uniref:tetratricopeptide repeat protein n=1 Tax=Raoultella terrigena TaxID=577 RepID=UPI0013308DB0
AMLVAAREQAALGSLPHLLFLVARDHATSDRWSQAAVGYDESAGIARELRQTRDLAAALAGLAWLEARQGRADACRAHAEEALALCAQLGGRTHELWSLWALGELELALGNPALALGHLVQVRELL